MKVIPYNDSDEIFQRTKTDKKSSYNASFKNKKEATEVEKKREVSKVQQNTKLRVKLTKIEQEKYRVI